MSKMASTGTPLRVAGRNSHLRIESSAASPTPYGKPWTTTASLTRPSVPTSTCRTTLPPTPLRRAASGDGRRDLAADAEGARRVDDLRRHRFELPPREQLFDAARGEGGGEEVLGVAEVDADVFLPIDIDRFGLLARDARLQHALPPLEVDDG